MSTVEERIAKLEKEVAELEKENAKLNRELRKKFGIVIPGFPMIKGVDKKAINIYNRCHETYTHIKPPCEKCHHIVFMDCLKIKKELREFNKKVEREAVKSIVHETSIPIIVKNENIPFNHKELGLQEKEERIPD